MVRREPTSGKVLPISSRLGTAVVNRGGSRPTPFTRVWPKPRRVWMPINELLHFLDTFRLTDSWRVFVEIECFNGHASYRSTFSDRFRSGTFAGPAWIVVDPVDSPGKFTADLKRT